MKQFLIVVLAVALGLSAVFASEDAFTAKFKAQVKEAKAELTVLSLEEVLSMMKKKEDFIILDVRDAKEVEVFGRPQWDAYKNISRGKLEPMLGKSGLSVDDTLVVLCKTSGRAALAGKTLKEYGFNNVIIADGGMDKWLEKNYPEAE